MLPYIKGDIPLSRGLAFLSIRTLVRRIIGETAEADLFLSLPLLEQAYFCAAARELEETYSSLPYVTYLQKFAAGDLTKLTSLTKTSAANTILPSFRLGATPLVLLQAVSTITHRLHNWGRF